MRKADDTTYAECDSVSGVFRGGALAPGPPFQPTLIFYDGIFGCFTIFFLLKHQNLGIQ